MRFVISLVFIFFTLSVFQNCSGGTIVTTPLRKEKIELGFDAYLPVIEKASACVSNVQVTYSSVVFEEGSGESKLESRESVELKGFDFSYVYFDKKLNKYVLNAAVINNLKDLNPEGTLIGEYEIIEGDIDNVKLGFTSACHDSRQNLTPSFRFTNQHGSFADQIQKNFVLEYSGDQELAKLPIDNFVTDMSEVGDQEELLAALDDKRRFNLVGFNTNFIPKELDIVMTDLSYLSDGTAIAVGRVYTGEKLIVAKYTADGELDQSFGNNPLIKGIYSAPSYFGAFASAEASDGGVYVASSRRLPNTNHPVMAVLKLNANGLPDFDFGEAGWVYIDINDGEGKAEDILLDSAGNIIIVGQSGNGLVVVKLRPNGEYENSFGDRGIVHIPYTAYFYEFKFSLAQQGDGKILVGGHHNVHTANTTAMLVVRLNANGDNDTSFNADGPVPGRLELVFGEELTAAVFDIVVSSETGSIYLSGSLGRGLGSTSSDGLDFAIVKLLPSGLMDESFADSGLFRFDFGGEDYAKSLLLTADDRLIVSGESKSLNGSQFPIMHLSQNGAVNDIQLVFSDTDSRSSMIASPKEGTIQILGSSYSHIHLLTLKQ